MHLRVLVTFIASVLHAPETQNGRSIWSGRDLRVRGLLELTDARITLRTLSGDGGHGHAHAHGERARPRAGGDKQHHVLEVFPLL